MVPPFGKEPGAASRTPKTLASDARRCIENHPTKRHDETRCKAVNEAFRHHRNHKDERHIAQKRKQGQVPTSSVLLPRVNGLAHRPSLWWLFLMPNIQAAVARNQFEVDVAYRNARSHLPLPRYWSSERPWPGRSTVLRPAPTLWYRASWKSIRQSAKTDRLHPGTLPGLISE